MEFKDLPLKVQVIVMMMHSIGVLESLCESQNLTQKDFENVVAETYAAIGVEADYMKQLIDGLTAEEERLMNDYLDDHNMEVEEDNSNEPKVH
ncbi:hypothetical protein pEaSNUABM5_00322 [Erwinia phage pEa_SNUABM_5]|uniref:Uncharacterized protein n=1 Tax=Erwinia phage pEa_SNUABM_5 TaxID=2797313 RepID=A0A7T8EQB6_9CAUD|nr:hypothetical protein MPK73_gp322 [Erwinia phage pEa_SNUABM_5]QQO90464.1 hypothetical protein pEaSNUABM5_00322 [Erwinia phage pEa_SNUABM_5]